MQRLYSLVLFSCFLLSLFPLQSDAQSQNNTAHVRDDLSVFIHTGPSRNYRIIGSINAGEAIQVQDRQGDPAFVQITDTQGRTGWIEAQYMTTSGTLREQVPELQNQLDTINTSYQDLQQAHQRLLEENRTLTQQNQRITMQLDESTGLANRLQNELDNADNTAMIEWFTRGGIVALVSLIVGVLLTYIPKKRRRNDEWM